MQTYVELNEIDRPVAFINQTDGKVIDVYQCAADAEIIAEVCLEQDIIDLCNGASMELECKYRWAWYDPDVHGNTWDQANFPVNYDAEGMFGDE